MPACPEGADIGDELILEAQAVPSATFVPCVEKLPAGWGFVELDARRGAATLVLANDQAMGEVVRVELRRSCDTGGAPEVPSPEPGVRKFTQVEGIDGRVAGRDYFVFEGGCVYNSFDFTGPRGSLLAAQVGLLSGLVPRDAISDELEAAGFKLDS
jgi:hypothetical protein